MAGGVPALGLATLVSLRGGDRRPDARASRWSAWAGLCFGLHQLAFMVALKATSVTDVALMNVLAPIVVALVAVPLFGERTGAGFRAWSAMAMLGAGVVVLGASSGPEGDPLGMGLAAVNVVAFAGFFLISKRGRTEIDVLPFLFGVVLVAAVAVTGFVLVTAEPVGTVTRHDLLLALAVAVGPGSLGHFMSTWPLDQLPANLPPVLRLAQPLLSGALAAAVLGEVITAAHLAGGALTITGILGAVRSRAGQALVPSEPGAGAHADPRAPRTLARNG